MMFRSQTDEQLAARWDKEPYEKDGNRYPVEKHRAFGIATFAPRVECIPSRDRFPFAHSILNGRIAHNARSSVRTTCHPGCVQTWAPRPEFARPPVNRVLVAFRATPTADAESWTLDFRDDSDPEWTPAEVKHARKVLARLAALDD